MAHEQRIFLSPSGLAVADAGRHEPLWRCRWDQVREVVAWKVDAFVYDVICIGLRVGEEPEYLSVTEDAVGYDELLAALKYRYGVRLEDWFARVAFPAFRENRTVLWARAGGAIDDATKIVSA